MGVCRWVIDTPQGKHTYHPGGKRGASTPHTQGTPPHPPQPPKPTHVPPSPTARVPHIYPCLYPPSRGIPAPALVAFWCRLFLLAPAACPPTPGAPLVGGGAPTHGTARSPARRPRPRLVVPACGGCPAAGPGARVAHARARGVATPVPPYRPVSCRAQPARRLVLSGAACCCLDRRAPAPASWW